MNKSKYLSPWTESTLVEFEKRRAKVWARFSLVSGRANVVYVDNGFGGVPENKYWGRGYELVYGLSKDFTSLYDAQNYIDKELSKSGYVFLTQEQWDKYQLLI